MIVVTGATGKVGGEIVRALAGAGQPVRAIVRPGREPAPPAGCDVVRAPFAGVRIASIDPAGIAAVAAVALTSEGHAGQAYPLSGPESLLPAGRLRVLGEVVESVVHPTVERVVGRPPRTFREWAADHAGRFQ